MAIKYIEIVKGTSDAKYPADRGNANAAGIYVDSNNNYALTYIKNGVVRVIDDSPSSASGISSVRANEKVVSLALTGAAVHAAAVGIVNPEGVDLIVTQIALVVTTHATAASGLVDVGTTTVSITTASDNLADGLAVGSGVTVPVVQSSVNGAGANGKALGYWTAGKWITVSDDATADVTGMVATLLISYIPVN